jgi:hypothetical protein
MYEEYALKAMNENMIVTTSIYSELQVLVIFSNSNPGDIDLVRNPL